ncbi:MAG: glycosyltransferase family 2 protein [Acidimicrobiia bacterium]
MTARGTPLIVVLGMMTKMPVAGVVWQTLHYLIGFTRLGYDVYYVEAHARTPSMLMERQDDDGSRRAADFIHRTLRRFGLGDRWAFHALHDDGRCYGNTKEGLDRLYRSAAMVLNLHGGTMPLPEHSASGRLVYLETDPVQLQVELDDDVQDTIDFLEPHCAFFTFGESYGSPACGLPVSDRFVFHPTRQPVVIDLWDSRLPPGDNFTTVGNWRQAWRDVRFRGDDYSWSKHEEFRKFMGLPRLSSASFELALSSCEESEQDELRADGWQVRDGLGLSVDIEPYRRYICSSRGEFTVAKDQNVRLCTGWFSDRSATYLAAGRPVITQETGFSDHLPTGEGLFGFATVEEAVVAVEAVQAGWAQHSAAATEVARAHFSSDVVLGRLIADVGFDELRLRPVRRQERPGPDLVVAPLPDDLVLLPTSRRPTTLPEDTVDAVLNRPVPGGGTPEGTGPTGGDGVHPVATIIVITMGNLVFTRMCLESVLSNTSGTFEVVVVDNGSTDATPGYLDALAAGFPHVHAVHNSVNLGFAPAVNRGLALARGDVIVILNNDTIVPPGWLGRLAAHLEDPTVGMVGPVTGAAGNEARIATEYRTYSEMVALADALAIDRAGGAFDLPMLTMFCVAIRRTTVDMVGGLDERFEVGMFEDDDYAARVAAAGLRIVCADDAFVHHFGEASLGELVHTGRQSRLFKANRGRFEQKWARQWQPHSGRADPGYLDQRRRVVVAVAAAVPADAAVAVVSRGDGELLRLGGRRAWHFPAGEDGEYAGHHPADSDEALGQLEAAQSRGAAYLVFPPTARWWLDHYEGFAAHLRQSHQILVDSDDCVVVRLEPRPGEEGER